MILSKKNLFHFYPWAWWLIAVAMPWAIAISNIAIALLILVWLADARWDEKWKRLKASTLVFPFFIFYGTYAVGVIYSDDFISGFNEICRKIPILLLPLIAATGPALETNFIDRIKKGFAYSCFVVVVVSLVTGIIQLLMDGPHTDNLGTAESHYYTLHSSASRLWLHFSYIQVVRWGDLHPSYLSMYLLLAIFFLAGEETGERKLVFVRITAILVMIGFVGLLASRIAVLTFVATALYWMVSDTMAGKIKRVVYFLFGALAFGTLIWLNPVARFRVVEEPLSTPISIDKSTTEWNSVNYRLLEWRGAWSIICQNPILGVGTGDGDQTLKKFYSAYNTSTANVDYNAHNQYLQTWLEIGLLGLTFLLICLLLPWIKSGNRPSDISFIIIFSSMCLTESMLNRQKGIIFFSFFFALLLSKKNQFHDYY